MGVDVSGSYGIELLETDQSPSPLVHEYNNFSGQPPFVRLDHGGAGEALPRGDDPELGFAARDGEW